MVTIKAVHVTGEFFDAHIIEDGARVWHIEPAQGSYVTIDDSRFEDMLRELRELDDAVEKVFWQQDAEKRKQAAQAAAAQLHKQHEG